MKEIIISYYLCGKGESCAYYYGSFLGQGSVLLSDPVKIRTMVNHRPGAWGKSGSWRKAIEVEKLLTFKWHVVMVSVLQELIAYSRLVSSEEGHLVSPKDSFSNSKNASEGHKLACFPVWDHGFHLIIMKKQRDISTM